MLLLLSLNLAKRDDPLILGGGGGGSWEFQRKKMKRENDEAFLLSVLL